MEDKQTEKLLESLDSIAQSLRTVEDVLLDLDLDGWSERIEWYLNEFYILIKAKVEGNPNRPPRKNEASDNSTVSE